MGGSHIGLLLLAQNFCSFHPELYLVSDTTAICVEWKRDLSRTPRHLPHLFLPALVWEHLRLTCNHRVCVCKCIEPPRAPHPILEYGANKMDGWNILEHVCTIIAGLATTKRLSLIKVLEIDQNCDD